jgi:catechol 2,3-dioxygenase-like lactoylglutathione lyase family enzyme
MVDDVEKSVDFYKKHFGFEVKQQNLPYFAWLTRDNVGLILSPPFGPGGAAKPMKDGSKPEAGGGWSRIIINVDDLPAEVERLRAANVNFRNDIATGPGGSEILLDDPSGNPVELFQPAAQSAKKAG